MSRSAAVRRWFPLIGRWLQATQITPSVHKQQLIIHNPFLSRHSKIQWIIPTWDIEGVREDE
jgi:hypothetical protein